MQNNLAVSVNDLTVTFGDFKAVKGVSFTVTKGEIFGFLGANGAGKTTTIRVLCGLLPPSGGEAIVAGADARKEPQKVKSKVGYMSQKFTLYSDLTIAENLEFTARLRSIEDGLAKKKIIELTKFIDLSFDLSTMVKDLPTGVLQQIALVAATIHDPEIVFLDEPTAGVTPQARSLFWKLIRKMAGTGKTIFVTTHYMDEAEQCGRIALMRSGELIALDPPQELKRKTFSETMFELTPPEGAGDSWKVELGKQNFISKLEIFGMRYHVLVTDVNAFEKYRGVNMKNFEARKIDPTLEDVFIRLVEGATR